MNRRIRKVSLFVVLLLVIIFIFANGLMWKWMYPIDYEEEVRLNAEKYKLNPFLILAVIRVESNFNPTRESKKVLE